MAGGKIDVCLIPDLYMNFSSTRKFLLFFIPYLILFCITSQNALFWDTVQFGGDHANWYYSTNFQYLLLPDFCDSGHLPTFGMYIAAVWKIFGRGIFQSHAALLPFAAMIVWQSVRVSEFLFPGENKKSTGLTLVLLTQAVLMTQCTLVSPDVMLVALFLLAVNSILKGNKVYLTIAIIGLALVSNRAIMLAIALYFFSVYVTVRKLNLPIKKWFSYLFKEIIYFLPAAIIALCYFAYHYHMKGWVAAPIHSTWKKSFSMDDISRMPMNIVTLGWRIVELGNIVTVIVLCFTLFLWWKGKIRFKDANSKMMAQCLLVLLLTVFFLTAFTLIFNFRLIAQRYLMPLYLSIGILAVYLLFLSDFKRKKVLMALMVLVQLSGHFWTYPQEKSQGWEGTLGHLFYYPMRKDFMAYMKQHGIQKQDVATSGNMAKSEYRTDILTDTIDYKDIEADSGKYVWYCNVANSLNKSVHYYYEHLEVVKEEKRGYVVMVLFKRPD
ncbi:MAG: hypothetical protein WC756_21325 [Taibaiella sp.]|jgi:hypothetical protein